MNYLLVQQWPSTKGNHAGMEHMCDLLVQLYPQEYYKIATDHVFNIPTRKHRLTKVLFGKIDQWRYTRLFLRGYIKKCHKMFENLSTSDVVFLLEYHLFASGQVHLARYLKKHFPKTKIIALSHLSPSRLSQIGFNKEIILEWEKPIDVQLTLGSSLTSYFKSIGIPTKKIRTGYHYVDHSYYQAERSRTSHSNRLKAIVIGNLQRNFKLLATVVDKTPFIDWTICSGVINLSESIVPQSNVIIKGYIDEDSLKKLMAESDISVNILDDTVGSNVITTSMAMGLAIIASDVGSIRDYCNQKNALFCNNSADSFVKAITYISQNPSQLKQMQAESIRLSSKFNIENIHHWFQNLFV